MVLDLTISVSQDAKKIIINDSISTWGAPDKSTVALMAFVKYNGVSAQTYDFVQTVYDDNADNSDITVFEADYLKDGWHTIGLAVIPLAPVAADGAIRYNVLTSSLEVFKDSWETLTDYDLVLNSETLVVSFKDIMLYSKHVIKINCLWLDIVNNRCKDKKCSTDIFWFTRGQLFSMLNQFAINRRWEAQRMMENIEKVTQEI